MRKLFDFDGWEVYCENNDVDFMKDSGIDKTEFFWCFDPKYPKIDKIACFRFAPFPMNCGIVVSIQTIIDKTVRGQGLSHRLHKIKEKIARDFGYSAMVCTVEGGNAAQLIGAGKHGWNFRFGFGNKRFGNYNLLGVKVL